MLTKDDLDKIWDLLYKFYEGVTFPYMDGRFTEIEDRLENVESDTKDLKEDMEDVQSKLDQNQREHDKFFQKLDQNEKDHMKMFAKLDIIEDKVDGHGTRIKRLEKTFQSA